MVMKDCCEVRPVESRSGGSSSRLIVDAAGPEPLPGHIGQRRLGTAKRDIYEAPVELQPEILIQSGGGVDGGEISPPRPWSTARSSSICRTSAI
jgi:hypothetical protein